MKLKAAGFLMSRNPEGFLKLFDQINWILTIILFNSPSAATLSSWSPKPDYSRQPPTGNSASVQ
jgi:hypothetical protein